MAFNRCRASHSRSLCTCLAHAFLAASASSGGRWLKSGIVGTGSGGREEPIAGAAPPPPPPCVGEEGEVVPP
jgi:hypothetical protein